MQGLRRLLSYTRRCVDDYGMINSGDKIAVGVSGGKDSLALLYTLSELRRFYSEKFEIIAISVDLGFETADFSKIRDFCQEIDVEYYCEPSNIKKIVFDIRNEKNPCSLCSRLRRAALNTAAKERGCNKIALGHHFDDVVETFMLNLFYEGRIGSFRPVTYLDRTDITVIRPFIYVPEKDIKYFITKTDFPVMHTCCPEDKNTERENMKQFLHTLEKENKGLKHRIFGAMQKAGIDGYKIAKLQTYVKEDQNISDE